MMSTLVIHVPTTVMDTVTASTHTVAVMTDGLVLAVTYLLSHFRSNICIH